MVVWAALRAEVAVVAPEAVVGTALAFFCLEVNQEARRALLITKPSHHLVKPF